MLLDVGWVFTYVSHDVERVSVRTISQWCKQNSQKRLLRSVPFVHLPQPGFGSITLLQKFTPYFKILDPRLTGFITFIQVLIFTLFDGNALISNIIGFSQKLTQTKSDIKRIHCINNKRRLFNTQSNSSVGWSYKVTCWVIKQRFRAIVLIRLRQLSDKSLTMIEMNEILLSNANVIYSDQNRITVPS